MTDIRVNVDNFTRAETERMIAAVIAQAGGEINRFQHNRVPTPFDNQPVIRQNRDTVYSGAVVNVSAGASIHIPDAGSRYVSVMIVNQEHYVMTILHEPGDHVLTEADCGSPFIVAAIRVLVDPNDPADVAAVNALQDRFTITAGSSEPFAPKPFDAASLKETHEHLIALSRGLSDFRGAFGTPDEVDPVRHLLGTASGWGGFPEHEAIYLNVDPGLPVGDYRLTIRDVPVDAFWSITVYNADGYMEPIGGDVVSVNSVTATPEADGSVVVRFGSGDEPNTIPVAEGWNYMVRLYRPRTELLDGTWTFPALEPR